MMVVSTEGGSEGGRKGGRKGGSEGARKENGGHQRQRKRKGG